jgi:hypothetical protein
MCLERLRVAAVAEGRRTLDGEAGPAVLDERDVLDQPADGELAHGGPPAGLLVVEVAGSEPQEEPLLAQGLEQVGALGGERLADRAGHGVHLFRIG